MHVLSADQLIFARYALKIKIPFFISEHWSGYVTKGFKNLPRVKQLAYKRIAKRAKAIFPVSKFLENGMQTSGLKGNYHVIPNIVDLPQLSSLKNKEFTFIVVADIVDSIKNISGIVRAFQKIKKEHLKIRLSIVGDGPDYKEIESLVNKQPNGIKLLGRLPNHEALIEISKAQCLIVNSNIETFSVVLIEARGQGLQAIATDCGGPSEYADDSTSIIPIKDHLQLVNKMIGAIGKTGVSKRNIHEFFGESVGLELQKFYNK